MSAKLAAGMFKPSGYFNMDTRDKWLEVMSPKDVEKISGIGDRIQERLNNLNIFTIKELHNSINEPKEILAVIEELWERVDKTKDIRAVGVSLGNFTRQNTRQIALGEYYDINLSLPSA